MKIKSERISPSNTFWLLWPTAGRSLLVFCAGAGAGAPKASSSKPPSKSTSFTGSGGGRGAVGFRWGTLLPEVEVEERTLDLELIVVGEETGLSSSSPASYSSKSLLSDESLNPEPDAEYDERSFPYPLLPL
ncbi:hypothetical protein VKT23_004832 [Stygiomarasmius scandens]|uniref:Uncharacterized protein n=1 Tax=Marasmiellus scandens TaxID=2682957 RepID=A0ABR1JRH1_9AGAR